MVAAEAAAHGTVKAVTRLAEATSAMNGYQPAGESHLVEPSRGGRVAAAILRLSGAAAGQSAGRTGAMIGAVIGAMIGAMTGGMTGAVIGAATTVAIEKTRETSDEWVVSGIAAARSEGLTQPVCGEPLHQPQKPEMAFRLAVSASNLTPLGSFEKSVSTFPSPLKFSTAFLNMQLALPGSDQACTLTSEALHPVHDACHG